MAGYYAWGSFKTVVPLRKSEGYRGDWLGLRTLDESKKLLTITYAGDHLAFTAEFWEAKILPHLGP